MSVQLNMMNILNTAKERGFQSTEIAFARYLADFEHTKSEPTLIAALLAMAATREGHAFISIDTLATKATLLCRPSSLPDSEDAWQKALLESGIVGIEGDTNSHPLILARDNCLYVQRYYAHERFISDWIHRNAISHGATADSQIDNSSLDEAQATAARRAATSRFHIITGGPGTGKTTTVLSALISFLSDWTGELPPLIAAVAPTGKAVARLSESLASGIEKATLDVRTKPLLQSIECLTLHRLLGSLPHRNTVRHNARNPLFCDFLIVDEASMIDLALMRKLLDAIPENCRVLLLGDPDQLTSVDVGSALADMIEAFDNSRWKTESPVSKLERSYRFRADSHIYRLCSAARRGDRIDFERIAFGDSSGESEFIPWRSASIALPKSLESRLLLGSRKLAYAESPEQALAHLVDFAILCPVRFGNAGTATLNERLSRASSKALANRPTVYKPIIALENAYDVGVFNGDMGVIIETADDRSPSVAYFADGDAKTKEAHLSQLGRYDFAYALTIHKSQGSEFETVALVYGSDTEALVTRQLTYTGLSRARSSVLLIGDEDAFAASIERQADRATGLAEMLLEY